MISASRNTAEYPVPQINDGTLEQQEAITQFHHQFNVSTENMRMIVKQFMQDMQNGLEQDDATLPMIPSFVTGRPTGEETGKYLALDLGGTNLRVCEFDLKGAGLFHVHQQKYIVAEELKTGDIRRLCDFIADCVDNFISEYGDDHAHETESLQLGFTFSFAVNQTAMNRGTLMHWTKGFSCTNAVGKDVVVLLQDSFLRKNIHVHIAALVNDTVGTLMANAYRHPKTSLGIILGTGTNAAYYEKLKNIKKWKGGEDEVFEEMVVNMEWGAFDKERRVLPFTVYDNKLDRESINPHDQLFEKMMSGMYLGEIARNVLLHFVDQRILFSGESSSELNKQWGFETSYMSTIVGDTSADLVDVRHILEEILQIPCSTTLGDCQVVKEICVAIGRRAARLCACGAAGVLTHTGELDAEIAIDGSVYEFFPNFEKYMMEALQELFGEDVTKCVKFTLTRDGSGFGAAMIAMIAHKAVTNSI